MSSASPDPQLGQDLQNEDGPRKRQKFSRSRTACLQCRARKSKCGALPPDPCPNCLESHLQCSWPAVDGRSTRAKLQKKPPDQSLQQDYGSHFPPNLETGPNGIPQQPGNDWLDRLLTHGSIDTPPATSSSQPAYNPSTVFTNPNNSQNRTFDPNLPGPSNYYLQPPSSAPNNLSNLSSFDFLQPPSFQNTDENGMNPAQFMWAMSSQLPVVEESSPLDEKSHGTGPSPANGDESKNRRYSQRGRDGKIVKISWWRPHGQTAIAPGLKRITLKVRVDTPQEQLSKSSPFLALNSVNNDNQSIDLIAPDGAPSANIMKHLLDLFEVHFGCQFPFLDKSDLARQAEDRTGSVFLMNCIAGLSARFSIHLSIALPDLEPWAYGNIFYNRAKALLGSILAVPSREAVAGCIMMAHMGFGNDSESELWMLTGMAVRMATDIGLHINPPEESSISQEDRRLNRLAFFSVLLLDYALCVGVGRQTTFRVEDITQTLPTEEDIHPSSDTLSVDSQPRSPFPYAAQMMRSYGILINMLNRNQGGLQSEKEIQDARAAAIREYNQLPQDMQWNVTNLQKHCRANQGPIFLHLHLWMHTILASQFLTGTNLLRRGDPAKIMGTKSQTATPNTATASNIWRNSARTIGDILVLTDIINPMAYYSIPFTNQAFFVASCCYVKEIEQHQSQSNTPIGSPKRIPRNLNMTSTIPSKQTDSNGLENSELSPLQGPVDLYSHTGTIQTASNQAPQVDLSRALLTSVAKTNITTLQGGLQKQCTYWSGVAWVMAALESRIEGIQDVDLQDVTEKLKSFVSLPDAGLLGKVGEDAEEGKLQPQNGLRLDDGTKHEVSQPAENQFSYDDLAFLSLPFDMGSMEGEQNVTELAVPLPQTWQTEWFR